ncbi:hypothetical protein E2C01_066837 [Portunus trituberculatus]|uniref:Uncharacterized protein n=1 Tax=Portunus trituberculatus TaxID=210409 RepID=A0A5B7HTE8_PORTR|nr:hypothetical protein [Portunus trituberculatus]
MPSRRGRLSSVTDLPSLTFDLPKPPALIPKKQHLRYVYVKRATSPQRSFITLKPISHSYAFNRSNTSYPTQYAAIITTTTATTTLTSSVRVTLSQPHSKQTGRSLKWNA